MKEVMDMNRTRLAQVGHETVKILEQGWYTNNQGRRVSIAESMERAVAGTVLYTPIDLDKLIGDSSQQILSSSEMPNVSVTNTTTLQGAARLLRENPVERVCCLNFASAKNPGGGFLKGSAAQEESLAISSGLYKCLLSQPQYYNANRACGTALYTDNMIFSPDVPVFRNDYGVLLNEPFHLSFITAPAVNAKIALRQGVAQEKILAVMKDRIAKVLSIALAHNCYLLVLGAWGCGVFGNNPREIARLFAEALKPPAPPARAFKRIEFAVYDKSPGHTIIKPFQAAFNNNKYHGIKDPTL